MRRAPPGHEAFPEIGDEGRRTVDKGKDVHVFMAPVPVPVHKPRLGRGADLVEKGADGKGGYPVCVLGV